MEITTNLKNDGLGAQFQCNIWTVLYAKYHGLKFCYSPIKGIEHNYNNDADFINKVENLLNFTNKYPHFNGVNNQNFSHFVYAYLQAYFNEYAKPESLSEIRNIFWENKNRNFFNNNKFNIAVHIRRPNPHDNRIDGADTPDSYYLNIIKLIRSEYKDKDIQFHIYSQGEEKKFEQYKNRDTIFHINEDVVPTYIGMVAADILVTSRSSMSYSAAIINENQIYFLDFWHPPLKHWRVFTSDYRYD
jgi:hypothetical protein